MKYTAKKDTWISLLIWIAIFLPWALLLIRENPPVLAIIIFILPTVFLLWIWFLTYYNISEDVLSYRFGPFSGEVFIFDINEIHLQPRDSIVAAVLSFDRITLIYQKSKSITLSPAKKQEFINDLVSKNTKIEIIE